MFLLPSFGWQIGRFSRFCDCVRYCFRWFLWYHFLRFLFHFLLFDLFLIFLLLLLLLLFHSVLPIILLLLVSVIFIRQIKYQLPNLSSLLLNLATTPKFIRQLRLTRIIRPSLSSATK